jgi:rare lipoprotein A
MALPGARMSSRAPSRSARPARAHGWRSARRALASGVAALLAACASTPPRDGPPETIPVDLARVRDAEPKVEPIRRGGPNRPYEVFGRDYVPITQDVAFRESGLASWYGRKFHGRRTANGEVYDMFAMTAAHPTLPIPSYARVHNPANGRTVIVRVNDRGPFHAGRIIDLSYAAAWKLDLLRGVAPVRLERLTFSEIRSARRDRPALPPDDGLAPAAEAPPQVALAPPGGAGSGGDESGIVDAPPGGGFWVQLGAFRVAEGALAFQRRVGTELDGLEPVLVVVRDDTLYRLQAGPYANREQAQAMAERIRDGLKLVPLIVERR